MKVKEKSTIGFSQAVIDLDAALNYVEQEDFEHVRCPDIHGADSLQILITIILRLSVAGVNSAKTFVEKCDGRYVGVVWSFRKTFFINPSTLFIWQ